MALPDGKDDYLLLHNPRCSKSRAAHALLEERSIPFQERRYLEDPLSRSELEDLQRRLGRPVRDWVRRGEAAFREAALSDDASDAALIEAIVSHPVLLERPILVRGDRAAVGRPIDEIVGLLG